ncbi:MAG: hypothetical protein DSY55_02820, partial [Clostridia bacterium]
MPLTSSADIFSPHTLSFIFPRFTMKKTFSIPTITCKHCLMSIKRELKFVDGVEYVDGNVGAKTVL